MLAALALLAAAPFAQDVTPDAAAAPQAEAPQAAAPQAGPSLDDPETLRERYWSSPPFEPGLTPMELVQRPLIVNGERIPVEELKRFLVFGPGSLLLESKKFRIITDNELETRALGEAELAPFEISTEQLEREVAKQRQKFEDDYPILDFKTEVSRAHRDVDLWKEQLRQTMQFDRIFIPDDPAQWPAVTVAAVIDESGGNTFFLDDAAEVYELRVNKMNEDGLAELPDYPMMYLDILRSMVLDSLHKFAIIDYFPETLPEGAILSVDGTPIPLEEVFEWLAPYLTWKDVQDARFWLAKVWLLERDLEASGHRIARPNWEQYWSDETATMLHDNQRRLFIQRLADEEGPIREQKIADWDASYRREAYSYQRMLFDRQMLGLQAERFPSMWAYGEYQRLMASFKQRIADDLENEVALRSILDRTSKITGIAKTDAEVILVSAFDFDKFEWKENGWEAAREKAAQLRAELDAGADWKETLDMHSDFWDPPQPEVSPQKPVFGFKFKGRWGADTRNNLLAKMEESEYTIFMYGDAIADRAFFHAPLRKVDGPYRAPSGYYLLNVQRRTPPQRILDLNEERHLQLLQQYYLRDAFTRHARQLMDEAEIHGLWGPIEEGLEVPADPTAE